MVRVYLALIAAQLGLVAGCAPQYGKEDCATLSGRRAQSCQEYRQRKGDADIREEKAALLKAYRLCLQKYESDAVKMKVNCAVYTQALHEIEVKGLK
ncbi:MAG TPA: hypothetical protein VE201_06345 [Nitrospirales bacterium]|nr:hypothetical protein [Nitrospirales bacterium]